ncbi:hypothetical protein ACFLZ6_02000, partial [Nanoarchaeota archaeon]
MQKIMKLFSVLVVLVLGILAVSGVASAALPISDVKVEVEDRTVYNSNGGSILRPGIEKDGEIDVEVSFTPTVDMDEVQVEANIRSTGHNDDVSEITDGSKVHAGSNHLEELTLELPARMDNLRDYELMVIISGRTNGGTEHYVITANIDIKSNDHQLSIKDVVISPE